MFLLSLFTVSICRAVLITILYFTLTVVCIGLENSGLKLQALNNNIKKSLN